ncbi:hypothetical protein [Agrobacterium sp. NPDC090283]|uniref:hypothetical protein n=1 Tax=Agrobacterium sp. NPDC090283 TaxID=3363920 RepID=UPI00383BE1FB
MTERFAELDDIFARHEAEQTAQKQRDLELQKQQRDRIIKFIGVANDVIRPAMRKFGEYLDTKGCEFLIDPRDDQPAVFVAEASIKFTFAPPGQRLGNFGSGFPNFSFHTYSHDNKVNLHRSTMTPSRGGQTSFVGKCDADEITEKLVMEKLKDLVVEVLAR